MKHTLAATLLLPLLLPVLASANDGIGSIGVGGIVFRKTDAIAMKKEVLHVGHELISVDYEFVNETAADVDETIIFPLPAYPAAEQPYDSYYGQPSGFSINVDGKAVSFHTVIRASIAGADVTAQLRKLGLSDAQIAHHPRFDDKTKVAPFSAQQRQQMIKLKLIAEGADGELAPAWNIQVNYVWQQKFPANKGVHVHHEYRPFVATGPGEWVMDKDTIKRYCADAAFLKSWTRLATPAKDPGSRSLSANKVAYILKTGNTWKRGIEDFTLNIVKSDPTELISLCFPGTFKKIDAKTYQVHLQNFRPAEDLQVYFGNVSVMDGTKDGQMPVLNK